jgi:hypothetical protein
MKKIILACFALMFVGCAATSPEPQPSSSQPESTEIKASANQVMVGAPIGGTIDSPPTFHKGYKLTFRSRTSDYDVTYQGEKDGMLVFHFDTKERPPYDYYYTPDLKLVQIVSAQQQTRFDPPIGFVEFPLSAGKKWKVTYKTTTNSGHSMAEAVVEVEDYGPAYVPYGSIKAFRIKVHISDREVKRMNTVETYWYNPDIGYFVKHDTNKPFFEDPYELIAVSK